VKPAQKREVVAFLRVGFALSERRAYRVLGPSRSVQRYRSVADDQVPLRMRLRDLAAARVRYGNRRLHVLLQREGWRVNHKRVERLYRIEGLSLRRQARTKRLGLPRVPVPLPTRPSDEWGMDFLADRLADGRRFRVLTFVDYVSRVSPAIEAGASLTEEHVVALLERVAAASGCPRWLRVDNGPGFASKALDAWAHRRGVQLVFSRPGEPTDNPCVEAFTSRSRVGLLGRQSCARSGRLFLVPLYRNSVGHRIARAKATIRQCPIGQHIGLHSLVVVLALSGTLPDSIVCTCSVGTKSRDSRRLCGRPRNDIRGTYWS
jgi:putative transposase